MGSRRVASSLFCSSHFRLSDPVFAEGFFLPLSRESEGGRASSVANRNRSLLWSAQRNIIKFNGIKKSSSAASPIVYAAQGTMRLSHFFFLLFASLQTHFQLRRDRRKGGRHSNLVRTEFGLAIKGASGVSERGKLKFSLRKLLFLLEMP